MSESKRILVVASHPDDEVLGCGGTMAVHADAGDVVDVLIVVEGATSREAKRDTEAQAGALTALQQSACDAAVVLGARKPHFLGMPDNRLDGMELLDVIKPIEALINELKPQVIYTQHGGDLNIDHRIVHQAVVTACRPAPGACVRAIYGYETASSTEWASANMGGVFHPVRFVDISKTLERKRKAMGCYGSEMRPFPHARSFEGLEALARWRGVNAGVEAAEAFTVVREISSP
ncbi:MAG: PIG-L deacetylase family protein [Alphaproteobacteria bacterium]|jgi:LmbE family N-acetylglucosaminyl deacetylase|nr:PIG-L deacetylase family protein [Alphaproteobacteria bacterium]